MKSIDDRILHAETDVVRSTQKREESYLPVLSCCVCHGYKTEIGFDMALHIIEFHSYEPDNHIIKAEGKVLHPESNDLVDYAIDMANGIVQSRTYSKCMFCEEYLLRYEPTVHEHLIQFHNLELEENLQQIKSDYPDEQDMDIRKMLEIVIDIVVSEPQYDILLKDGSND